MKNVFSHSSYVFTRFTFSHTHHSNIMGGSPLHYLALLEKGTARLVTERSTLTLQAGDVFYIPRGLPYQSYWQGDVISFLSFGFTETGSDELTGTVLQRINCDEAQRDAIRAIPIDEPRVTLNALSRFYAALSSLLPFMQKAEKGRVSRLAERAKNFLLFHPTASAAQVAAHCHVSEPYLFRVFRQAENCTPNEYRTRVLCEKAVSLLTTTDETVETVSERLGVSSASYLCKLLKKETGKTPREIRKEAHF